MPYKDKQVSKEYLKRYRIRQRDSILERRREIYAQNFARPRKGVWAKGHSDSRLCLSCGASADIKPRPGCNARQHAERWEKRKIKNEEYRKSRRDAARLRGEVYVNYNPIRRRERERARLRIKIEEVRQRLGGKCQQCRFSDSRALQIDHKTGGGGKHRKSEGWKYRTNLHKIPTELLRKQFQLLCANCHAIKTYIARQDSIKP